MRLHLYGVVRAGTRVPAMAGVGDPPGTPRSLACGDVAAVVSGLDDGYVLTDDDATTHLDVLVALVHAGPVLPLRFGTEAPDEDSVRDEVLAPQVDELRDRLDALDGLAELRIDIAFDEDDALRASLAANPELRELAARASHADLDGQLRLGEAVADGVATWCRQRGDELVGPLAATALRARRIEGTEPHLDRWALLVRVDELSTMDERVRYLRELAAEARVDYVGPLPAFSFLDFLDEPTVTDVPATRWGW